MKGLDRFLKMWERTVRQTADIDDVGAICSQPPGSFHNFIRRHQCGIDDLGEDEDVVPGQISRPSDLSEEFRQIREFVGTAFEARAEIVR